MALKMSVVFVMISVLLAASMAEAQLGKVIGGLLGLISVQGTVFCTANGRVNSSSTSTPVFPNALVQLECNGNVVSSTTTNSAGAFGIMLDPLQVLLSSLLSGCNLVVTTPLSTCNASLPSFGGLISSLHNLGTFANGLLNITNLIPAGFIFQQSLNN